MGGLLVKIWGHVNFEKKSQKQECSLGNIGETPKMKNVLGKSPILKEALADPPLQKQIKGRSPIGRAAVSNSDLELCVWWTTRMVDNIQKT